MKVNRVGASGGLSVRALAVLAAGALLFVGAASCVEKIRVPPPPGAPAVAKTSQTFNYDHKLRQVDRQRRLVVALMRPGDVVRLADYLPFGRGLSATRTRPDGKTTQWILRDGTEDAPVSMPPPIRQFLMRELLEGREFLLIERERILEIIRELDFGKTKATDPKTTPRPGRLIGVHYIIEGNFYPVGGLPRDDPALDAVKAHARRRRIRIDPTRSAVMYLTIYKVETGEVKAVACGAALQPLVAVKRAAEDLVDQLADIIEPIKVVSVDSASGTAILDIGSEDGAKPGSEFTLGPSADKGVAAKVVEAKPLWSTITFAAKDKAAVKPGVLAHRTPQGDDKKSSK